MEGMEGSSGVPNPTPSVDTGEELKSLLEEQAQIKGWLKQVNNKIYDLEESYLEDTPLGNVVRGWDPDGKPLPLRSRSQMDEKERLFTYSSYQYCTERAANPEEKRQKVVEYPLLPHQPPKDRSSSQPAAKKKKKSKKEKVPEWIQDGDY